MLPYKDYLPRNNINNMNITFSVRVRVYEGVFGCMNEEN